METVKPFRVLSLGAGVQSSTLALMVKAGEVPMIDCAIFADTDAEPGPVYKWLDWLEKETASAFPTYRVMHKDGLTKDIERCVARETTWCSHPPFFADGVMQRRQCTWAFKVMPVRRKARSLSGGRKTTQLIGISTNEARRAKPSDAKYITHEFPLIEHGMGRVDCMRWMVAHGYPTPPRSACVYCPYRANHEWDWLRSYDPEGFGEACRVDALIRKGMPGYIGELYVHRSLVPLAEVKFTDEDRGQGVLFPGVKCDGMC